MLLEDRTLTNRGATRGSLVGTTNLETVRDQLRGLALKQAPMDMDRSVNQLHVDFTSAKDNYITVQTIEHNGLSSPMILSRNAYSQLAPEVLPPSGGGFLLKQAQTETGRKLATANWAYFARENAKLRKLRTVKATINGKVETVVRSVHSTEYAVFDNLQYVETLLKNTQLANLPVVNFALADNAMRLRVALRPQSEITLDSPVPMVEIWNSEVGRRRTVFKGGTWKLVCTNGMAHWNATSEFAWRHFGDAGRIEAGIDDALRNTETSASEVLNAYRKALDVSIDNVYGWLIDELTGMGVPDTTRLDVIKALDHATTTPGRLLASTIDAVTLVAQDASLFEQAELEMVGARLLDAGLRQAAGGRVIHARSTVIPNEIYA